MIKLIIIVSIVLAAIAFVVFIIGLYYQEKNKKAYAEQEAKRQRLEEEKQIRIKENTIKIEKQIQDVYESLMAKGVSSINKGENNWMLPKGETLYSQTNGVFQKIKFLSNGEIKQTLEGSGNILISDKAITIETNTLESGKRRYPYKKISSDELCTLESEKETHVGFNYNNAIIFIKINSVEDMNAMVTAFILKDNPIKDKNSISF